MTEKTVSKFGYFRIGEYLVDVGDNRVYHEDAKKHIEPKAMQVLYHMAINCGETVSRTELMENVWQGRVVMEDALTRTISQIRLTFDDSKQRHLFQTIPKKGYRLTQDVTWLTRSEFISQIKPQLGDSSPTVNTNHHIAWKKWSLTAVGLCFFIWLIATNLTSEDTTAPTLALPSPDTNVSIAFLPWRNLTGVQENDYLAEMLPEELSVRLANNDQIEVLAHYSALVLARESVRLDSSLIEQLHTSYIVEGSITEVSDNLRVLVRLVDTTTKNTVWSAVYEDAMAELMPLQNRIVNELRKRLLPQENSTTAPRETAAIDVNAYRAYLQGNYWLMNGKTSEWWNQAESMFLQATELDPNFAAAFGSLAFIYARYNYHDVYMPSEAARAKAESALLQALAIEPEQPDALIAKALLAIEDLRFTQAQQSLQRVLDLTPKNTRALYVYSELALAMNELDQAQELANQALQHDPLSPWINVNKAIVHFWRYELNFALAAADHAIAIDPNYTWAYVWKARILAKQGKLQQALNTMSICLQIDDGSPVNSIYYALLLARAKQLEEADKWLAHTASLYGDSADARFWQNYLAIASADYDTNISFQLLDKLTLKQARFFNLYSMQYAIAQEHPKLTQTLRNELLKQIRLPSGNGFWVNHRNQHAAHIALTMLEQSNTLEDKPKIDKLTNKIKQFEDKIAQPLRTNNSAEQMNTL